MAKLFISVIPGSECDRMAKRVAESATIFGCKFNCKPMPEERDANYYEICYGENDSMAEVGLDFVKGGPRGYQRIFMNNPISMSIYGLYRAEILTDDITLEQFIEREAG